MVAAADILKFTESSKGKGRGANDSNNSIRESILAILLTPEADVFIANPEYGEKWKALRDAWLAALQYLASRLGFVGYTGINVVHKGGRSANVDYVVEFVGCGTANVEFKFNEVPQFVSLPANKPIHSTLYAVYYYEHFLEKVMALYDIPITEKPTLEQYLKYVYQEKYAKIPICKQMYDAEVAEKALAPKNFKSRQTAIVKQSIHDYLALVADSTDIAALTAEFQRTQNDKHFLIYKKGKFMYERFEPDELIAARVVGVKGENLITESAKAGVEHHLKLRWRNHQGVLFPAWQVSLVRPKVKKPTAKAKKVTKPKTKAETKA